jgi:outer membrane protein
MKNLSLVFNVVLALAVGVLYYLHFTQCSGCSSTSPQTQNALAKMSAGGSKVVFVNSDSLLDNFTKFKNQSDDLEKEQKSMEASLTTKSETLQKEYAAFMQKAQSGAIDRASAESQDAGFRKRNEELLKDKDAKMELLMKKTKTLSDNFRDAINVYLKDNKNKYGNYDMVIGYQKNGSFLYVNDSLDITHQVLKELNDQHSK